MKYSKTKSQKKCGKEDKIVSIDALNRWASAGRVVTMTTRRVAAIDNLHLINDNKDWSWYTTLLG